MGNGNKEQPEHNFFVVAQSGENIGTRHSSHTTQEEADAACTEANESDDGVSYKVFKRND